MRLLIVTGIYPPDIGGPATHAADLGAELRERGHEVAVVTLWDGEVPQMRAGVMAFPRRWPVPVRMAAVSGWIARHGARFDAIYATGLHTEAVVGARLAGVPSILKVVGDPVWERGRRLDLSAADFEDFQRAGRPRDPRLRALAWLRDRTLRASTAIVTPSRYLAEVVETWLGGPSDVRVIANGVSVPAAPPALPGSHEGLRVAYVGRLVPHKRVDRLIAGLTTGITLDVIGSGPHEADLRAQAVPNGATVTFHGDLLHADVLGRLAAADVLALASDYEGLPHVAIEALAVGTPVVAPAVGGVPEALTDGENGLILSDSDPATIRSAFVRLRDDEALLLSLADGARASGSRWRMDRTAAAVAAIVDERAAPRPRAVFVGKTQVPAAMTLGADAWGRYEILTRHTRPIVLGVGDAGIRRLGRTTFVSLPELRPRALASGLFYGIAPLIGALIATGRSPAVIVCQSPYEGLGAIAATRMLPIDIRPAVVVEVHGDWRTASRLYGSPARRILSPVADAAAAWAVRHADAVRVIGSFTKGLVRDTGYAGPVDVYTAFGGLDAFLATPPVPAPDEPEALFVGVLERYKSVDVLLEAWRTVAATVPGARLTIIGDGAEGTGLRRQAELAGLTTSVRFLGVRTRPEIVDALDRSRLLTLPSRSEGMGRVILEAFARGRPVVATAVGGIPELVHSPELGRLVPADDPGSLAKSLIEMLIADPATRAASMRRTRAEVEARDPYREFEAGIERLSGWAR